MVRRRRFLAAAWAAVVTVALAGGPTRAADPEAEARRFIESLADQAIRALTQPDVPRQERIRRFRKLFNENFAVQAIGRWILGRHWPKASESERREYLKLFQDLLVVSYVDRFTEYAGESLKVVKTAPADGAVMVHAEIVRPAGGPPVRVDWRVATQDGKHKIIDLIVEGTSMSATMRSEFGSVIRQKGGEVAGLLEELRSKTESLSKEDKKE